MYEHSRARGWLRSAPSLTIQQYCSLAIMPVTSITRLPLAVDLELTYEAVSLCISLFPCVLGTVLTRSPPVLSASAPAPLLMPIQAPLMEDAL